MAGVPPTTSAPQLWGNPVYNWEKLQQLDFQWWVQRFQAMLDIDIIRIDHFRGFQAWGYAVGKPLLNGEWIEAPEKLCFRFSIRS